MQDAVHYALLFVTAASGLVCALFLPSIIAGMRGHPRLREIRQINVGHFDVASWAQAMLLALSSREGDPSTPVRDGWRPSSVPPPDLSAPIPDAPAVTVEKRVCGHCGTQANPFAPACLRCGAALGGASQP